MASNDIIYDLIKVIEEQNKILLKHFKQKEENDKEIRAILNDIMNQME